MKTYIQETEWRTWIGLIWLRTGTCNRLLQTWWTFGFDKMCRVCRLANELLASQEGLYSMKLSGQSVSWLPIIRYLVSISLYYWRSLVLVYTQSQNTHHAFLHNTKYFFKFLYYNSGTLTVRSCRIFSKCNKCLTRTWHSSTLLISVFTSEYSPAPERIHTDHIKMSHYTE
jgi:hypothetical protein